MLERSMKFYGISREELARMLRMSVRTLYRRMKEPTTWSVGEIAQLRRVFQWTKEQENGFFESCMQSGS